MKENIAINVNLSTSGSHLGGAAIASEYHSRSMAKYFDIELWRMWDCDEEFDMGPLKIKSFQSRTRFPHLEKFMPRRVRACLLDSNILNNLLSYRPSIVHLHNPIPSFAFENIAKQAANSGIKVVASTHGFFEVMHPNYSLKRYEKWLWQQTVTHPIRRALGYMDSVFALYPDEIKMLQEQGIPKHKIHLIPNGVNPFFLKPPQQEDYVHVQDKFGVNTTKPILLFIGNHTANKGLDTVMRVANQLSSPATIVVGGRLLSPDEPDQWAKALPPKPAIDVVFTDYLTLEEQRAFYHLATLLLFPSVSDTLPLTIIEAMACELPVVAYDVGGISYQLAHESGVVVPKDLFTEYLQTVETLLNDQDRCLYLSDNAKIRQQSIFSWESAANKTLSVYKSLLI